MLNRLQNTLKNRPTITLTTFNMILAVWIAFIFNYGFLKTIYELTPYQGISAIAFIVATSIVLVALYNFIFQLVNWRYSTKFFSCLFLFVGGISAYIVNSLGVIITADQIQNAIETNPNEAFDLMTIQLLLWSVYTILIPIFAVFFIQIKPDPLSKTLLKKTINSVISLLVILTLLYIFFVDYAAIFRGHRTLKGMISPQNTFASTWSYYKKHAPKKNLPHIPYGTDAKLVQEVSKSHPQKLMVLVVGETARAESFSLNGYNKMTNPSLSQLDIINFPNVSSCGTSTAVSVPCMFSGMTRKEYDAQLAYRRDGLLDIAQRAGYHVTWIDNNSGCKRTCDRVTKFEIPQNIQQKWCNADGECDDGILVDSLKYYIDQIPKDDQTPRLVVLHQMGSHGPAYYKRTRPEFQKFKPTCDTKAIQSCDQNTLINTYDNSIVYTDHILSSMIKTLEKVPNHLTGFWYISDHGESTGEHGMYLHGAPYAIAPSQQTHVPMLMWFSKEWNQFNAQQASCMRQLRQQELSHDHLFPTLLHLLDVKTSVINEKNDILNTCKNTI
ncbi:phosphoethanolamine--lipid A transferase [Acinetobacter sp. 194]|uniref:phosphoethanolamine transferase n=1 Tax=Acinetobacter shaoyimingii TaxID=2715164 RepID=UPI001407C78A|nr:phosphoethanolamine--lipid A transferase [Acinetobacter shaoyimingii]NHB58980.1 phosphoethanolamine--lipid A transferase [Acinetobacter shaoyimingii]